MVDFKILEDNKNRINIGKEVINRTIEILPKYETRKLNAYIRELKELVKEIQDEEEFEGSRHPRQIV